MEPAYVYFDGADFGKDKYFCFKSLKKHEMKKVFISTKVTFSLLV